MKEIRNYKNIRRKPQIMGFSPNGFYIFMGVLLISLFVFSTGFSFKKAMLVVGINFISAIITKIFISNKDLIRKIVDEKFPKEISSVTRKTNK